ncbi:hypothetical protein GCM10023108_25480 [Saccharopolyspora hordei]
MHAVPDRRHPLDHGRALTLPPLPGSPTGPAQREGLDPVHHQTQTLATGFPIKGSQTPSSRGALRQPRQSTNSTERTSTPGGAVSPARRTK